MENRLTNTDQDIVVEVWGYTAYRIIASVTTLWVGWLVAFSRVTLRFGGVGPGGIK